MSRFSTNTVLFQPDTRLICHRGNACPLLRVARADRTASAARQHAALFIHTEARALEAQAVEIAPNTKVANSPIKLSVPGVATCWSLDPTAIAPSSTRQGTEAQSASAATADEVAAAAGDQERDEAPNLPRVLVRRGGEQGSVVLVYVHGFRQRFRRIVSVGEHFRARLGRPREGADVGVGAAEAQAEPAGPVFVTFAWPSHKRGTAYGKARHAASIAAESLRMAVAALRCCGFKRVVVIGHSLGCRVSLHAALNAPPEARIDHLILMAAAVSNTDLGPKGEFSRKSLVADEVTVLYSGRDNVLGRSYEIAEATLGGGAGQKALGRHGPHESVPGVHAVDVSSTVGDHNPNVWLLSASVLGCISSALYPSGDCAKENSVSDAVDRIVSTASEAGDSSEDSFTEEGDESDDGDSDDDPTGVTTASTLPCDAQTHGGRVHDTMDH